MNNTIITILFLFSVCTIHGQTSFSLGGGIERNLTIDAFGGNLRAYYNVGDHFCIGPEFSAFLPKTIEREDETEEIHVWEVNLNAHYIFELNHKLGVYPIIGLNYTREREEITLLNSTEAPEEETVTAWAANFGFGFHVPFDQVVPFAEYHFTTGKLQEHIVSIGVFYMFGKEESE